MRYHSFYPLHFFIGEFVNLFLIAAQVGEKTCVTHRLASLAHIASVKNKPVVSLGYGLRRDIAHKLLLCRERITAAGGEAYSLSYPENVSVDCHGRPVEYHGEYDISRLAADAGQAHKAVDVVRNLAAIVGDKFFCQAYQRLGLVVGVRTRFYQLEDFFGRSIRQSLGGGKSFEQGRRDDIDTFVGTLCGQDNGNEQLVRIGIPQLGLSHRHLALKTFDDGLISFGLSQPVLLAGVVSINALP